MTKNFIHLYGNFSKSLTSIDHEEFKITRGDYQKNVEGNRLISMQIRIIKVSIHLKFFGILTLHQLTSKVRIVINHLQLQLS